MAKPKAKVVDPPGEEARMPRATKTTVKILAAFLERPTEERHGFKLFEEIGVKSGSGYPVLLRFEKLGWLSSRWEESEEPGPRRRLYRLTAHGEPAARQLVAKSDTGSRLGITKPLPAGGAAG